MGIFNSIKKSRRASSDIDEKIDSLNYQTGYLVDLLKKDISPNDLVKDFEVESIPTKQ